MEPIYKPSLGKIDKNSIKTTTMLSFVVFALFLIIFLLIISTFFMNTYYSTIRIRESMSITENLATQFKQDPNHFQEYALDASGRNSLYIRLEFPGSETMIFDGTNNKMNSDLFKDDIKRIREKLTTAPNQRTSQVIKGNASNTDSRWLYAANLFSWGGQCTLFVIAPLFPDSSTINVIRNMLFYISIILLIIAIGLAYFLSSRLTSPIKSLTDSATELSQGNFNVKFNGYNFTETKALASALNKASYEMEKTDFYQREIMANVSHDLKTPLTMIRGYAEKIQDISGDNPEKRNEDLNIIISETERLNNLVTDMMTVSNLQSNNILLNKEVFDITEAAAEVYDSISKLGHKDFELDFITCKPTFIDGDRNKIIQVMTNFITNAIKYSGDNKYIKIQIKRVGKKVAFHCIDKGVGIPSSELSHVWDRYYRASKNHEREIEGSGLGLSIVKGILTLHNASYGVNSEEGKGSDFWFEMETVRKPARMRKNEEKK